MENSQTLQKNLESQSSMNGIAVQNSWSGHTVSEIMVQEARQNAFEIELQALKEYQNYKNIFFEKDYEVLQEQYENKFKQYETRRVIERSRSIQQSRFAKMELRNKCTLKLFCDMQAQVYKELVLQPDQYIAFLKASILQGLLKLMEQRVFIRCLQRDVPVIQTMLIELQNSFKQQLQEWYLVDVQPIIVIDLNNQLIERKLLDFTKAKVEDINIVDAQKQMILKSDEDQMCFGGVILASNSGKILCQCTLDVRTLDVFKKSLPLIRQNLFPTSNLSVLQTQPKSTSVQPSNKK